MDSFSLSLTDHLIFERSKMTSGNKHKKCCWEKGTGTPIKADYIRIFRLWWFDVSWFDLSWFDTNHVTYGFVLRKRCKQRQARVLAWDPKQLEKHLGGKEGFTPKNVSATKLESRQTHFTWRGRLYCVESGDLGCLPFDGKFRKFRMEGKW